MVALDLVVRATVEVLNGPAAGGTFGTGVKHGRSQNVVLQVLRSGNGHRFRVNLNWFRQPLSWPCSLGAAPSLRGDAVAVAEATDEIGGVAQAGSGGHGVE